MSKRTTTDDNNNNTITGPTSAKKSCQKFRDCYRETCLNKTADTVRMQEIASNFSKFSWRGACPQTPPRWFVPLCATHQEYK